MSAIDDEPVSFKVVYESAEKLVTEYTSSISRGGFVFIAKTPPPLGTRFIFNMSTANEPQPIQIHGKVVRVRVAPGGTGRFEVGVQYLAGNQDRSSLEGVLNRLNNVGFEVVRREARVPVNLLARNVLTPTKRCLIFDISMGGFGLCLALGEAIPERLVRGSPAGLVVTLRDGVDLALHGKVAWAAPGDPKKRARVGIQLTNLVEGDLVVLSGMKRLFRPPKVTVALGEQSVARLAPPGTSTPAAYDAESLIPIAATAAIESLEPLSDTAWTRDPKALGDLTPVSGALCVRVDLAGDVDGELALCGSMLAWVKLVTRFTGSSDVTSSVESLVDAAQEILGGVAGKLCDLLEQQQVAVELGPPLEARMPSPGPDSGMAVVRLHFADQAIELAVVCRSNSFVTALDKEVEASTAET